MNQWALLSFKWDRDIPMTAAELAAVSGNHRTHVYRKLAGVEPVCESPRRWFPRDASPLLFGTDCEGE